MNITHGWLKNGKHPGFNGKNHGFNGKKTWNCPICWKNVRGPLEQHKATNTTCLEWQANRKGTGRGQTGCHARDAANQLLALCGPNSNTINRCILAVCMSWMFLMTGWKAADLTAVLIRGWFNHCSLHPAASSAPVLNYTILGQ